jgi:hypothetical protein
MTDNLTMIPLKDYPRPSRNTRLGFHLRATVGDPAGENYKTLLVYLWNTGVSWLTILAEPDGAVAEKVIEEALFIGFMVNVRFYHHEPYHTGLTGGILGEPETLTLARWKNKGWLLYIQAGNEGDLADEWRGKVLPPENEAIAVITKAAVYDCQLIQGTGHIPIIPPCATGSPRSYRYNIVPRMLAFVETKNGRTVRGRDCFNNRRIALGIHDYGINHPVGDLPGESDWYPYDKVNQEGEQLTPELYNLYGDPGFYWGGRSMESINAERRANKNPGQVHTDGVKGGAAGVIEYLQQYDINIKGVLPAPIPLIGTESGVSPLVHDDQRYWRVSSVIRVARHKVINKRLWNDPTVRHHYPAYYFCGGNWLTFDRGTWGKDSWFTNGHTPSTPEYAEFFGWCSQNFKDMNWLYGGVPVPPTTPTTPTTPVPVPPTSLPPRELTLQDTNTPGEPFPTWIAIRDAIAHHNLKPGDRYWRISKVKIIGDKYQSDPNCFIMAPRSNTVKAIQRWFVNGVLRETFTLPLNEKPANEPPNNFPIWGIGNEYSLELQGYSDMISGIKLPGNLHWRYEVTFTEETVPMAPLPPTGQSPAELAFSLLESTYSIRVTPAFALPTAIMAVNRQRGDNGLGFDFVSNEFDFNYVNGNTRILYKALGGQNYNTMNKIVALAPMGQWEPENILLYEKNGTTGIITKIPYPGLKPETPALPGNSGGTAQAHKDGVLLDVDYESQLNPVTAKYGLGDCIPSSVVMAVRRFGTTLTPDRLSLLMGLKPGFTGSKFAQVEAGLAKAGFKGDVRILTKNGGATPAFLIECINKGLTPLILGTYELLPYKWDANYMGAHCMILKGYEYRNGKLVFIFNDPYFPVDDPNGNGLWMDTESLTKFWYDTTHNDYPGNTLVIYPPA